MSGQSFEKMNIQWYPGHMTKARRMIEENAEKLGIPIRFFESDIFDSVRNVEKNPCYLCARMRRGRRGGCFERRSFSVCAPVRRAGRYR